MSDDEPDQIDLPSDAVGVDVTSVEPRCGRYVAALAAELGKGCGFDGHVTSTIPVGGLSSSAALDVVRARARHVATENHRVAHFAEALARGDYVAAGTLMVASHRSLSDDFGVSTPAMDRAVRRLLDRSDVFGARLTGGGFGGCVVALCRPGTTHQKERVRPVRK